MRFGVQFKDAIPAKSTRGFFTHSWPEAWRVIWNIVPTGPTQDVSPQIESKVQIERQASNLLKYYIYITNLTSRHVNIEARYAILD